MTQRYTLTSQAPDPDDTYLESTSSEESACWPPEMLYDVMEFLRTGSDNKFSITQNHAPSQLPYELIKHIAHFTQNADQLRNWRSTCKSHFFALQENWEKKHATACLRDFTWLTASINEKWESTEDLVNELIESTHPETGIYNQMLATPLSEEVQTLLTLYALSSSFYCNNNHPEESDHKTLEHEINLIATTRLEKITDEKIAAVFSKFRNWQQSATHQETNQLTRGNNSLKNIFLRSYPLSSRISHSSLPLLNSFMNTIAANHFNLRFQTDEYLELFLDKVSRHPKLQRLTAPDFSAYQDRLSITELIFNLTVIKISNFDSRIATTRTDLQPTLRKLQTCFALLTQTDKILLLVRLINSVKINENIVEAHTNPLIRLNDFQIRSNSGWPAGWSILLVLTNTLQDETSRLNILTSLADMLEDKVQLMRKIYAEINRDIKTLERVFPRSIQLLNTILGFPATHTDLITQKLASLHNEAQTSIHEKWEILSAHPDQENSTTESELHNALEHLKLTEQSGWPDFPSRFDFILMTTTKGLRYLKAEAENLSSSESAQIFQKKLNSIAKQSPFYREH